MTPGESDRASFRGIINAYESGQEKDPPNKGDLTIMKRIDMQLEATIALAQARGHQLDEMIDAIDDYFVAISQSQIDSALRRLKKFARQDEYDPEGPHN
jgi:hypothetical protein